MKNIHVLPTEKPSILYAKEDNYKLTNSTMAMDWYISSAGYKPYNIYITSDKEISGFENNIWVILGTRIWLWENTMALRSNNKPKKIILTTDQDLIKDGVQAIDDEFLEWFVKNPSCDRVEVSKYHGINTSIAEVNAISGDGSLNWEGKSDLRDYKIIIPKEEPKTNLERLPFPELVEEFAEYYKDIPLVEKQETLEEVAKQETFKNYPVIIVRNDDKEEFIHLSNGMYRTKWGILHDSISSTPLESFDKSKFTFYYE
jgi:hypothetical protein